MGIYKDNKLTKTMNYEQQVLSMIIVHTIYFDEVIYKQLNLIKTLEVK